MVSKKMKRNAKFDKDRVVAYRLAAFSNNSNLKPKKTVKILDIVFEDILGYERPVTRILSCKSNIALRGVLENIGRKEIYILLTDEYYPIINQLFELKYEIISLKSKGKTKSKKYKYYKKLYNKIIKFIREDANILERKPGYKGKYHILNNYIAEHDNDGMFPNFHFSSPYENYGYDDLYDDEEEDEDENTLSAEDIIRAYRNSHMNLDEYDDEEEEDDKDTVTGIPMEDILEYIKESLVDNVSKINDNLNETIESFDNSIGESFGKVEIELNGIKNQVSVLSDTSRSLSEKVYNLYEDLYEDEDEPEEVDVIDIPEPKPVPMKPVNKPTATSNPVEDSNDTEENLIDQINNL